ADAASKSASAAKDAAHHADEALNAAKTATLLVDKAAEIEQLAREADAQRLRTKTDLAKGAAEAAAAAEQPRQTLAQQASAEAVQRAEQARKDLAAAASSHTQPEAAVAAGRRAAMYYWHSGEPWVRIAAQKALLGDAEQVRVFATSGYQAAAGR